MGYFSEGGEGGILSKNVHCKTCWAYFEGNVASGKFSLRNEHCRCMDKRRSKV